ncbi:hypothetical protein SLS55_001322 [Diplodia seriata]|uniref:Uncharacterized protein n=1 Tax=Diplodia seriata TaxID=420778 RepID=A0ABR3CWS2_9PEZI
MLTRIDLNPASPTDEHHPDSHHHHNNSASTRRSASILAPPLSPTDAAAANIPPSPHDHRRRSMLRDLLHLRGHDANSTSEERLAMARRMAIDRNSRDANMVASPPPPGEDDRRRSRRLSNLFRPGRHGGAATTGVGEAALPQPPAPVHDGGAGAASR